MRNIFIVNATQVIVSSEHPEGIYSSVTGYPKTFDSRSYPAADGNPNGDTESALKAAKAEYYNRLAQFYAGSETRAMATLTLENAKGHNILTESMGGFPDPEPEPEPEPEEEQ